MGKWESPTEEDAQVIRSVGLDPKHCAVSRPGEHQLVILNWLDHNILTRETYVRLPENKKNPK